MLVGLGTRPIVTGLLTPRQPRTFTEYCIELGFADDVNIIVVVVEDDAFFGLLNLVLGLSQKTVQSFRVNLILNTPCVPNVPRWSA